MKFESNFSILDARELVKLHYVGVRRIVKNRDSPDYVGSFIDDLYGADGSPNWCEAPSGSYE